MVSNFIIDDICWFIDNIPCAPDVINPNPNLGLVGHYHPPTPSFGVMSFDQTVLPLLHAVRLRFICQHHPLEGHGPCGQLIDGDALDALDHFASAHVHSMGESSRSDPEKWICHWRGRCGIGMRRENFRRHIVKHLFRWKCSNCLSSYSRDDTAKKHAKGCGDGQMHMVPRKSCGRLWQGRGG